MRYAVAAVALASPAVYLIHIMSLTWTGVHTAIVLLFAGLTVVVFGATVALAMYHATMNRARRDVARTEAMARPLLLEGRRVPVADPGDGQHLPVMDLSAWVDAEDPAH